MTAVIEWFLRKAQWASLPADARITVHRDVEDIARFADARYLCHDLSWVTPCAAEMLSIAQPIIVVPSGGGYRLLGGFRTWQAVQRVQPWQCELPVLLLRGRVDPEAVCGIALFDVAVRPLLTSLDRTGPHQIDMIVRSFTPAYDLPGPGRPSKAGRLQGPLDRFFKTGLSVSTLARIMALSPSTIRRGR
jgi:hypothetical protein